MDDNLKVGGTAVVDGASTLTGTVSVTAAATLADNLKVGGTASVVLTSSLAGSVSIGGGHTCKFHVIRFGLVPHQGHQYENSHDKNIAHLAPWRAATGGIYLSVPYQVYHIHVKNHMINKSQALVLGLLPLVGPFLWMSEMKCFQQKCQKCCHVSSKLFVLLCRLRCLCLYENLT